MPHTTLHARSLVGLTALALSVLALVVAPKARLSVGDHPAEVASGTPDWALAGAQPPADTALSPIPGAGQPWATGAAEPSPGAVRPAPAGSAASPVLGVPAVMLEAYRSGAALLAAEQPGCRLSWSLLAAIGRVESGHASGGRVDAAGTTRGPILGPRLDGGPGIAEIRDTDGGRLDGDTVWDRAVGPMQFIPSTWRGYAADGNADAAASPHNAFDAAAAAGRYLCVGGGDLSLASERVAALFRYNRSAAYGALVLRWAAAYDGGVAVVPGAPGMVPAPSRATAVQARTAATPMAPPPGEALLRPASTGPLAPVAAGVTTTPPAGSGATTFVTAVAPPEPTPAAPPSSPLAGTEAAPPSSASSPTSTSLSAEPSTTAPPPESTTAPPPESTTAPPPETTTAPPPETTTAPPPETTTAPPPKTTSSAQRTTTTSSPPEPTTAEQTDETCAADAPGAVESTAPASPCGSAPDS